MSSSDGLRRWCHDVVSSLREAAEAEIFQLSVVIEAVPAALAAEARLLHAAERDGAPVNFGVLMPTMPNSEARPTRITRRDVAAVE